MPNRMLRDWTLSEKMNALHPLAERFFTRLIMKVDDYGCFYADTRILKSNLFPLLLDNVREADLTRWMAECQKAGLVVLYENAGKKYLQILDFRQRLDRAKSKYPLPQDVTDSQEVVNDWPPELEQNLNTNLNTNENADKPQHTQTEIDSFENFKTWIKEKASTVGRMKEPFTIDQYLELKKSVTSDQLKTMILKMHNYEPLLKKNKSAYLTFKNWASKDFNTNGSEEKKSFPHGASPQEQKASKILNDIQ